MLLSKDSNVHFSEERETKIYRCRYNNDVHRNKWQALIIATLTHSLDATKIARRRHYTIICTIIKCKDIQSTIGAYKCVSMCFVQVMHTCRVVGEHILLFNTK
jgi:hypothetical protein